MAGRTDAATTSASRSRKRSGSTPAGGGGREQRVVADRAGQVGVELADGRADPEGRRGPAAGQPGPQPVAGLVEAAGQLGAALQVVGGLVRRWPG